jgi:hypothetical protein
MWDSNSRPQECSYTTRPRCYEEAILITSKIISNKFHQFFDKLKWRFLLVESFRKFFLEKSVWKNLRTEIISALIFVRRNCFKAILFIIFLFQQFNLFKLQIDGFVNFWKTRSDSGSVMERKQWLFYAWHTCFVLSIIAIFRKRSLDRYF